MIKKLAILAVGAGCAAFAWNASRQRAADSVKAVAAKNAAGASAPAEQESLSLCQADRKFLWDTENVAFQIIYKTGNALGSAVTAADPAAIAAFFTHDFQGSLFVPEKLDRVERPFGSWRTGKKGAQPTAPVDRQGFAAWLAKQSLRFRSTPQFQLQVIDLAPVDKTHHEGPWRGVWILRICGEAGTRTPSAAAEVGKPELFPAPYAVTDGKPLEITMRGRVRTAGLPTDFARGREWIAGYEAEQFSEISGPKRLMTDVTASTGIKTATMHDNWRLDDQSGLIINPGGVYACDPNGDGRIDLLVTDQGPAQLYINEGGMKFVDRAAELGLPFDRPASGIACSVDLDGDGDEDLVLGKMVFENKEGRYVRRGFLPLPTYAAGLAAADYDKDGKVDLYVSCVAPAPKEGARRVSWVDDQSGPGNLLFRNLGDFKFKETSSTSNAQAGKRSTFTSNWLDANDDGWPDLYAVNELGNNLLLLNDKNGSFREAHIGPKYDGFAMGLASGDVNEDGTTDLYIGNMKSKVGQRVVGNLPEGAYSEEIIDNMKRWVGGNILLVSAPGGKFVEMPGVDGGGWSYGPAMIDFDGDGRLDLFSTCGFVSRDRREPDG
ncbi:MAG TPA: VCBS repeat-containing protein [Planctomycetia bacterium]|nr:VCBS repeat-containing protein [Planctomycetia bacterium]